MSLGYEALRHGAAWLDLSARGRYLESACIARLALALLAPPELVGIHTNLLVPALNGPMPTNTDEERAASDQIATFGKSGNGYFVEMATRPQTIGYALLDSPLALSNKPSNGDARSGKRAARRLLSSVLGCTPMRLQRSRCR